MRYGCALLRDVARTPPCLSPTLIQLLSGPSTSLQVGWTPLHYAAMYGHTPVVEALLKHPRVRLEETKEVSGCWGDSGTTSITLLLLRWLQGGKTPLDLARQYGHTDVVMMLEAGRPASVP